VGQAATVIAVPYLLWGPSIAQEMVKPATEQAFTKTVRYFQSRLVHELDRIMTSIKPKRAVNKPATLQQ
jgi:hypothetical protein